MSFICIFITLYFCFTEAALFLFLVDFSFSYSISIFKIYNPTHQYSSNNAHPCRMLLCTCFYMFLYCTGSFTDQDLRLRFPTHYILESFFLTRVSRNKSTAPVLILGPRRRILFTVTFFIIYSVVIVCWMSRLRRIYQFSGPHTHFQIPFLFVSMIKKYSEMIS